MSTTLSEHFLKEGTGIANGSFGELLQGLLPGDPDNHFLVTLPIHAYSKAKFTLSPDLTSIEVSPVHKVKSLRMAQEILDHFGVRSGGRLHVQSNLEEGKGFSSSSADLVATARAIGQAIQRDIPSQLLLHFMRGIEPTDGVMFGGSVLFYHRKVQLGCHLGYLPRLRILAIDEGGKIDSVEFNRKPFNFSHADKLTYSQKLRDLHLAFRSQDISTLGKIASESAQLYQKHNPKKHLDQVLDICKRLGGLGVVVTHSGPCTGVLLSRTDPDFRSKEEAILSQLKQITPKVLSFDTFDFPKARHQHSNNPGDVSRLPADRAEQTSNMIREIDHTQERP